MFKQWFIPRLFFEECPCNPRLLQVLHIEVRPLSWWQPLQWCSPRSAPWPSLCRFQSCCPWRPDRGWILERIKIELFNFWTGQIFNKKYSDDPNTTPKIRKHLLMRYLDQRQWGGGGCGGGWGWHTGRYGTFLCNFKEISHFWFLSISISFFKPMGFPRKWDNLKQFQNYEESVPNNSNPPHLD